MMMTYGHVTVLPAETATLLADLCREESAKSQTIEVTATLSDRQEQVNIIIQCDDCLVTIIACGNKHMIKLVGELARALPNFKGPLLSVDVMAGMYDSIERYLV